MPLYRISRVVVTDAIEVEADSPAQAQVLIEKGAIEAKTEFSYSIIEEVLPPPQAGYREETSVDVLTAAKAAAGLSEAKG